MCKDMHVTYHVQSELTTLEWYILNPDLLINLEINNKRKTSIIKSGDYGGSSINPDFHHSKVSSSDWII